MDKREAKAHAIMFEWSESLKNELERRGFLMGQVHCWYTDTRKSRKNKGEWKLITGKTIAIAGRANGM